MVTINITDEVLLLILGFLFIAFLPQIHLFLILLLFAIGDIAHKVFNFISMFFLPVIFFYCTFIVLNCIFNGASYKI